jgi:hypothetical protein
MVAQTRHHVTVYVHCVSCKYSVCDVIEFWHRVVRCTDTKCFGWAYCLSSNHETRSFIFWVLIRRRNWKLGHDSPSKQSWPQRATCPALCWPFKAKWSFTVRHCTVPNSALIHFVMTQKKTAIISLNSINRLDFAMGTVSVYRAVRIGSLCISKNSIRLLRPASHRGGPGLIPGHSMWIRVDEVALGQHFCFPCQYNSTDGQHSSSFTRCFY